MTQIRNAICDLLDVRNKLSKKILKQPKDNDGSFFTIDDCLENAIHILEELEKKEETVTDYKTWSIRKLKSFLKEIEHGGQGTQDLILKDQIIQLIESKRKNDERGK